MKPKVFATRRIPSPGMELLFRECDVTVHEGGTGLNRRAFLGHMNDKDGLVCVPGDRVDREVFDAAPALKAIATCSVGYEHIDVAEATKRGIYVGYTPGVLTDATADLAFALLMSSARRIAEVDRYVRAGRWQEPFDLGFMLGRPVWGATIGIVGFGRIGQAMAARAGGFRMRVFYHDSVRYPTEEGCFDAEYLDLDSLLSVSDFVSIHVPYLPETHHLIGERELRLMKRDAVFINTSRGPVVDEVALVKALEEGLLAGAGLDVYEREPLPADSPLLGMDNVTLAPHVGSATAPTRSKMAEITALNLLAALRGEAPVHWLNPEASRVRPLAT